MKSLSYLLILPFLFGSCEEKNNIKSIPSDHYDIILEDIQDFKGRYNVKGLSFAVFTDSEVIDKICIGKTTYNKPVDDNTLFNIQSISKNFTATAVMMAVQDSLLELDAPVTEYLPNFKVNSCFENDPEKKITVEKMLSHTAGFTHEAPVGNNFDYRSFSIESHIESINDTWLKFPVGTNYAYSNLGYDLTTKIIADRSGLEFSQYIKDKVLLPLGMKNSTVDDREVRSNANRTEGDIPYVKIDHYPIILIGSGAVYTSLNDMIKYTQFLMNEGNVNGNSLLGSEYLFEMFRIRKNNYGLGTYIGRNDLGFFISHSGGGYGYTSTMIYYPEYGIGTVLLCNGISSPEAPSFKIMETIINQRSMNKDPEVSSFFQNLNSSYYSNRESIDEYKFGYCPNTYNSPSNIMELEGTYKVNFFGVDFPWLVKAGLALGYVPSKIILRSKNGMIKMTGNMGEYDLRELEEGLLFTEYGEVLDLRSKPPTFRNIPLTKAVD